MPSVGLRYANDMPKIYPRYTHDMSKIGPRYAYGRQGLGWIVGPEYSFRVQNEKPTWNHKKHKNRPGTMKNQPCTRKNHDNPPGTMKKHENPPGTMTNHENPPGTRGERIIWYSNIIRILEPLLVFVFVIG